MIGMIQDKEESIQENNQIPFERTENTIPKGHATNHIDHIQAARRLNTPTILIIVAVSSGFFSIRFVNFSIKGETQSINFSITGIRALPILSFILEI